VLDALPTINCIPAVDAPADTTLLNVGDTSTTHGVFDVEFKDDRATDDIDALFNNVALKQ